MREKRFLPGFLRLCLSGMLVFLLHEFLGEGVGLGERPAFLAFLPLLAGYIAGCFIPGKRYGWLLLLPGCAASLYGHALVTGVSLSLSGNTGLTALDAVLLFILGRSRKEAWPSALGLPAAGLGLLTCMILGWRGQNASFPGLCTVVITVICLLDMHREGVESGLHNAPGEAPMPYPRGLRRKNWLLVVLFLGIALGVAAVPGPQKGADHLWGAAVSGTKALTSSAAAKLRERADQPPASTPSPSPTPTPTPEPTPEPEEPPEAYSAGVPAAVRAAAILGMVLLAVGLFALWRKGGKTGLSLRKLLDRLKRLFRESEPEVSYEDEVEKLRPWKERTGPARENVRKRIRKAGRKRIRLEDLPDDRMRIRYVYRELVRNPAGVKLSPAMTPSEVGAAYGSEPIRGLVAEYNIVRYAPGAEVPREAGGIAASAMKELRAAGKRSAIRSRMGAKPDPAVPARTGRPARETEPVPNENPEPETLALLPAAPVWLPLATVGENIRSVARDKAAALRAAELVGLSGELLRAAPKTLTAEQQWLAAIARCLASEAGSWEADLSALDPDTAGRIAEVMDRLTKEQGITLIRTE